jgi:5-methylcytosine-specific restriction protein A
MASALLKACPVPGCPQLTSGGRCEQHRRGLEQQRRATGRLIDVMRAAWERTKERFRLALMHADVPLVCGARLPGAPLTGHSRCAAAGLLTAVDLQVDHIRPHRENRVAFLDLLNLQYLCASCHSVKTVTEDGGFGR